MVATPPLFKFILYFGVPEPRIKLEAAKITGLDGTYPLDFARHSL